MALSPACNHVQSPACVAGQQPLQPRPAAFCHSASSLMQGSEEAPAHEWAHQRHHAQGELYRSLWERAMDATFDRLLSVSAEGLTFVGHIATSAKPGAVGKLKFKVWPSLCVSFTAALVDKKVARLCSSLAG